MVGGLAQHDLLALVPADDAFFAEPRQDGARRRAADAQLGGDLRLRGQRGIPAQRCGIPVVGFLENRILPCHHTPLSALVTVARFKAGQNRPGLVQTTFSLVPVACGSLPPRPQDQYSR